MLKYRGNKKLTNLGGYKMLSFSVNQELPNVYLDLSSIENTDVINNIDSRREWLSTLYLNMCDGKADQDSDLAAYAVACKKNSDLTYISRNVPIISKDELENGVSGVSEDVLEYVEKNIDEIADRASFVSSVKELIEFSDYLELEEDVDLVHTMLSAVRGNKRATEILITLKNKYAKLKEVMYEVMSTSGWSDILEGAVEC